VPSSKVPAERPSQFLAWIPAVVVMNGKETLNRVGLDAYMLLRFIRLCTRISLFSSIIGLIFLIPVFVNGNGELPGFNSWTLNNIGKQNSYSMTLWVSTIFACVFAAHTFYLVNAEYKNYVRWRIDFLTMGSVGNSQDQTLYTVMVEGLPSHLKTNSSLERYFNRIFPNQVFSANVQLEISALEELHARRLRVVDALERAVAYEHVTGLKKKIVLHGPHWPQWEWSQFLTCGGLEVAAVSYLRKELVELNTSALSLQVHLHADLRQEQDQFNPVEIEGTRGANNDQNSYQNEEDESHQDIPSEASSLLEPSILTSQEQPTSGVSCIQTAFDGAVVVIGHLILALIDTFSTQAMFAWQFIRDYFVRTAIEDIDVDSDFVKKTETAFVTFTTLSAVKQSCSCYLTDKPHILNASLAPDADEILWENISMPRSVRRTHQFVAGFGWLCVGICWSGVVSLCSSLGTSADDVLSSLSIVNTASPLFSVVVDYGPITFQLGLLALIPVMVQWSGTYYEGLRSRQEVQNLIMSRYFAFQVINIFVTIGTVSLLTFISDYDASDIPSLLVNTFPQTGGYFIEFILVKTMFGLPWELSRAWASFLMASAWLFTDKRQWTMRSQRAAYLNYPGEFETRYEMYSGVPRGVPYFEMDLICFASGLIYS
jgi:hypothetical protein